MMGHRGMRGSREHEALSARAKRYVAWRSGVRKALKRAFNKRQRRRIHEASAKVGERVASSAETRAFYEDWP